jgi:hypothetical protein
MSYSNSPLSLEGQRVATDKIPAIVVLEYYDGPETGVIVFDEKTYGHFDTLGDSESRLLRAFRIEILETLRQPKLVELVQALIRDNPGKKFIVADAKASQAIYGLLENTTVTLNYLAIGPTSLDWLEVAQVEKTELNSVQAKSQFQSQFSNVQKYVTSQGKLR